MHPYKVVTFLMVAFLLHAGSARAQLGDREVFEACMDSCTTAELAGDYDEALVQLEQAWDHAQAARDQKWQARVVVRRGVIKQRKGDYNGALRDFFEGMRLYEALADRTGLSEVYNNIGSIHHYDKNYAQAGSYYAQCLAIREHSGTLSQRAQIYNNIAALLEDQGRADTAMVLYRRVLSIRVAQLDTPWIAVTCANIGSCFDQKGERDSARHYLDRSLALIRTTPNRYLLGSINIRLGLAMLHGGQVQQAIIKCEEGLAVAMEQQILPLQEKGCDCLRHAYEASGDTRRAFDMLQRYMAVRDSMFGQQRAKDLARIELTHNFERQQFADSLVRLEEQREAESTYERRIERELTEKRLWLVIAIGILLMAGALWSRLRYMRRSRNAIEKERQRSDELLLNILPKPIAEELKRHGVAEAKDIDNVSILFTDFKGFTQVSEELSAQELVGEINRCFKAFDEIMGRHGLEKIKTIGDAYMAAGGLTGPTGDSARSTVHAALDMQAFMEQYHAQRIAHGKPAFNMRAGIHTGPVVAGIVGDTKFQYDIWGDTVNIASRMESSGEVGEVNISESTYRLIKDDTGLLFTPRGRVQAKGKGEMEMYFVRWSERTPERAKDQEASIPVHS